MQAAIIILTLLININYCFSADSLPIELTTVSNDLIKQKIIDNFLIQEAEFIAEEDSLEFEDDINDFSDGDLDLTNDQDIIIKRSKERLDNQAQKADRIRKIMNIDYKIQHLPLTITDSTNTANNHIPKAEYQSNFQKIAFLCSAQGNVECLRVMLDNYVDINSKNDFGHTLLMQAIISSQLDTTRLLLARRSNLRLKDNEGSTALDLAKIKLNQNIIQSILAVSFALSTNE